MTCECCCGSEEQHEKLIAEIMEELSWMAGMAKRGSPAPSCVPVSEEDRIEAWKIKNDWRWR